MSYEKFLSLLISAVSSFPAMDLYLENIDVFTGRNNIIYLSPSKDTDKYLTNLRETILISVTEGIAFDKEDFSPEIYQNHLTLSKHVSVAEKNKVIFEAKKIFTSCSFKCSSVVIFKNEGQGWHRSTEIKF